MVRAPGRKAPAKKAAASPKKPAAEQKAFNEQTSDNVVITITPAMIAQSAREIVRQRSVVGTEAAILAGIYKRWEAQGINKDRIKEAIDDLALSPAEVEAKQRDRIRYAIATGKLKVADDEWTGKVQQAHMDFLPAAGEESERLRAEAARQQGLKAGRRGFALDANPYRGQPGSPEFVGWRDGHGEGTKLRRQLKPDADKGEKLSATPSPRKQRGAPAAETPAPEQTPLQRDEAAYRAKGTSTLN